MVCEKKNPAPLFFTSTEKNNLLNKSLPAPTQIRKWSLPSVDEEIDRKGC